MLRNPTCEACVCAVLNRRTAGAALCAVALVSAFFFAGCASRKARAFPWSTAVLVHPRLPAKSAPPAEAEPVPDLRPLISEPPPRLGALRSGPPRPRAAAGPDTDSRPDAPMIVPQLSAEESAAAQKQTKENLAIAQRNLAASRGRSLSATQADLAGKIRSFIEDAGKAAGAGDWVRARNLAQKAQVLSEALARSF